MAHSSRSSTRRCGVQWLPTGAEAQSRMLAAIHGARQSLRLEMYIFHADGTGARFRTALASARTRGVQVQVLLDAFGSSGLPADYWQELRAAGGDVRFFNPLTWQLFALRNHRKLLLIDDQLAIIGGFNIADEYNGDGVTQGWRDLGWELHRADAVGQLAAAFDATFRAYDQRHHLLQRLRHRLNRPRPGTDGPVLLSGPRLRRNPMRVSLRQALRQARHVQIISGYFLPTFRLRRALRRVARQGGTVELILAGKSDVPIAQRAGRSAYSSLLRAGVRIYEYQPQILHAKLAIVDDAVFAGSANLDIRSFGINYELMVRIDDAELATEARGLFASDRQKSKEITRQYWRSHQNWFTRLRGHWASFLFTRIDPWLARRQLRTLS